ncbi:MAG TPA: peptidoglycan-binding protein [Acidimicrobiia bacterium]|nr:peptidoglycan-binding protein [Acidimicrobiia bacterium]
MTLLRRGDEGEAVRDLHHRLARLGHVVRGDDAGAFGLATESAVRTFQEQRGLHVDGVCGPQTWNALVESGFRLGDRLLYVRRPMLRGDDVATLQHRLNALGFDAGREDGILGDQTARAVREFQRNAGVAVDGIAGPATLSALGRLGEGTHGSVAAVRERESLRHARPLHDSRVYISTVPGLDVLGTVVERGLLEHGARVLFDAAATDDSAVAAGANRFEADLFLGIRPGDVATCRCAFFATATFRSESGYRLASSIQHELAGVMDTCAAEPCARTYPLLRETRMAAVVCEPVQRDDAGALHTLVRHVAEIGDAIVRGVRRGFEEPVETT